ncbi:50S ribosomal protein L24 [Halosquirtibacter xylanolyticus]|uniref:50S ribosomal protein L24 n=1 Tax=Halosquirtibacter xylanolyticus TaxID=3374599 RepID=UPI00374858CF|nr:50S ribosomal protein L24 [Prolixibacteraceae bacterium]
MQKKFKIKKGDTVKVIAGSGKGETGKVLEVIKKTDRVIVEGVNLISKHVKPNAENPQGGIIKQEAGIHISNLMFVDASTKEVTRVGRRLNEDGKLVRYTKKSKEEIK